MDIMEPAVALAFYLLVLRVRGRLCTGCGDVNGRSKKVALVGRGEWLERTMSQAIKDKQHRKTQVDRQLARLEEQVRTIEGCRRGRGARALF